MINLNYNVNHKNYKTIESGCCRRLINKLLKTFELGTLEKLLNNNYSNEKGYLILDTFKDAKFHKSIVEKVLKKLHKDAMEHIIINHSDDYGKVLLPFMKLDTCKDTLIKFIENKLTKFLIDNLQIEFLIDNYIYFFCHCSSFEELYYY